ncbi:MAG: hypothetical protein HQM02_03735 [Magnetococcales bacterium]|nr:hypothetical protein [Magnetococcales bacterium]
MHHNASQHPYHTLSAEEQAALTRLHQLHAQVMQTRTLARNLEGLLSANPYRNKAEDKVAHLREEVRKWHGIRRQATHARQLDLTAR